jgi:uncharacterized membrane protein (UPF0136 family)
MILIFAAVMFAGGLIGYLTAGSRASLISGSVSAALLVLAFFLGRTNPIQGLQAAAVLSAMLAVVFAIRAFKTRKFMPAGMLLILSIAAAAYFWLSSRL